MAGKYIFLVPGYGTTPTPELWLYAMRIAEGINEEHPDLLVISGGESQKVSHPGMTEAQLLWEMIQPKLMDHPHIFLETGALTSLDNVLNVTVMIRASIPSEDVAESRIVVACERNRWWKMFWLVWLALPEYRGRISVLPVQWEFGPLPKIKQSVSTFGELLAFHWPWLAERGRESRRRRAERI